MNAYNTLLNFALSSYPLVKEAGGGMRRTLKRNNPATVARRQEGARRQAERALLNAQRRQQGGPGVPGAGPTPTPTPASTPTPTPIPRRDTITVPNGRNAAGRAFDAIRNEASRAWQWAKENQNGVWDAVRNGPGKAWQYAKENQGRILDAIRSGAGEAWGAARNGAGRAWDEIGKTWQYAKENPWLAAWAMGKGGIIGGALGAGYHAYNGLMDTNALAQEAIGNANKTMNQAQRDMSGLVGNVQNNVIPEVLQAVKRVDDAAKGFSEAPSFLSQIGDYFGNALNGVGDWLGKDSFILGLPNWGMLAAGIPLVGGGAYLASNALGNMFGGGRGRYDDLALQRALYGR